jgi:DNA excision repair protein ERCC-3
MQVIIFSDNVFALKTFAKMMDKYYICGDVKAQERLIILDKFVTSKHCNIIFVSKAWEWEWGIGVAS